MMKLTDNEINLMSEEELEDPSITATKLHNSDRAYFYDNYNPPFFIFSRYEDVNNSLLDSDTYLEGHGNGPNFQPAQGVISDAPHHTYIRKLIQHNFLTKQIQSLESRLQEIVEMLLDEVEKKEVWDVHDDLSFPLPVIIICEILGMPTDDINKFKRWADASVANMCSEDPLEFADELNEMREYILKQIQKKRIQDDSDLLSLIANAKKDDKYLSDDESVGLATQIFVAGNETTTSLISNLIWRLLTIGNLWREFTEEKIDLDDAINESLRFDPPLLGLFKTTSHDVNIGGILIPANTNMSTHAKS